MHLAFTRLLLPLVCMHSFSYTFAVLSRSLYFTHRSLVLAIHLCFLFPGYIFHLARHTVRRRVLTCVRNWINGCTV